MPSPRLTRMTELRRALPLVAAALLLVALSLPVWRITLTAPQYPGDPLPVDVYTYPRLGGEWKEVQGLNKYAGFYYPDPVYVEPNYEVHERAIDVPEWVLGPVAFVGLALASAVVAASPTERLERALAVLFGGAVALFGAMAAIIQYRLYQAGHTLDPDAPLMGIDEFTPPILGSYEVANISGTAGPGPGGVLAIGAVVLLGAAFAFRDSTATISDVPTLLDGGRDRLRERVRRRGSGTDRPGGDGDVDRPRPETDGGSHSDSSDANGGAEPEPDESRRPRTPPEGDPP